ncbi:hyccin [Exaiptasia diaphana]|uniref:Hyccin n=1 Tax=Exaiptasia diaphana TaxID=2652724 RepID=A0A913Y9V7_EXADI|nr:hyccin [Exaiptasia diaphana]KXJ28280.1 Protein FAM126B [Exaiptasia diaphana]
MEYDSRLYDILQECSTLTPQEAVQKLNKQEGFITTVISSLSDQYKKQAGHPIYSTLFELYRSKNKEARCFVLQFLPSIIWIYLSAKSRRDKQGYGRLEAILLSIYNAEVQDRNERKNQKSFRLPSLSRPSIYHESSVDIMSQSALTESALSRHELAETPILGPTKEISKVTASNRMSVLCVALRQYKKFILFLHKSSYDSFWLMAIRVAAAGFSSMCAPETTTCQLADVISNEELSRLANHPRIPLSAEYIQELIHSLYFLMYNGCAIQACRAIESLHFRACHSLLASANVLSNAVMHSLKTTNMMPQNGPLGLQVHRSDSHQTSQDYVKYPSAFITHGMVTALPIRDLRLADADVGDSEDNKPFQTHKKTNGTDYWQNSLPVTTSNIELTEMPNNEPDNAFTEDTTQNSDIYTTKL